MEIDGVGERDEPSIRNSNIDIESLSDADLNNILKKAIKMKLKDNMSNIKAKTNKKSKYFLFIQKKIIPFNRKLEINLFF